MIFPDLLPELIPLFPQLRGSLSANEPLAPYTWFRVGGPAQLFYLPADEDDLVYFLRNLPREIPLSVISKSNIPMLRFPIGCGQKNLIYVISSIQRWMAGKPMSSPTHIQEKYREMPTLPFNAFSGIFTIFYLCLFINLAI